MKTNSVFGQMGILALLNSVRPWTMATMSKVRIGNDCDGGYVLPAIALECDAVVSIGIGGDVSFDLVLAQRGACVLQFDHTVDGPPQQHPGFQFQKLGWGPKTEGSFINFKDIHTQLMALKPKHALLKFDIEGAEFDALKVTRTEHLASFDVICCEIHNLEQLGTRQFFEKVNTCFSKLTANHIPVHLHANNYSNLILVEGIPIPRVLELSFLRKDLDYFRGLSADPIPGPLDRPNNPHATDFCLNPF